MSVIGRHRLAPVLAAAFLIATGARAAADTPPAPSYPIKLFRWDEDYAYLRGKGDLPFPLSLKYVPLGDPAYVSFGGEMKIRVEGYDHPNFGLGHAGNFTALSERVLLHADVHPDEQWRVFVQLGLTSEDGRLPVERPFDKGGLDLAQGFADYNFDVAGNPWRIRLGRQEVGIGRYITIREGTAIRRTFDGGRVDGTLAAWSFTALAARPTRNRRASFDDEPDPSDFIALALVEHAIPGLDGLRGDLIGLLRDNKNALYLPGPGRERRATLGLRVFGAMGPWDVNFQASHEFGTFTPRGKPHLRIAASGAAFEGGYTQASWTWSPRLAVRLDAAQGDGNAHDHTLATFDLPYPDLSYLTDAAIIAPRNVWDIDPFVALHPARVLTVTFGTQFLWRMTPNDAVFTPIGTTLLPPGGPGMFVAAQPYVRLSWDVTPFAQIIAAYVRAEPGNAVRAAGGAPQNYVSSSLSLKF